MCMGLHLKTTEKVAAAHQKNDGFRDVQYVFQAFASSEQAEVEEQDGGLDGSDGDGVMDFADIDVLVHVQL